MLLEHPQIRTKTQANVDPAVAASAVDDWLAKGSFVPSTNVVQSGANFRFGGKAGLKIAKHAPAGPQMSVSVLVRQVTGTRGYLFSKSDKNGGVYRCIAQPARCCCQRYAVIV